MPKRKKQRYSLISPNHKDSVVPAELKLLNSRALLAVRNFTHYNEEIEKARALMERLFREYKRHPEEVLQNLENAFSYIQEKDYDKEKVKQAVKEINILAKKVWDADTLKRIKDKKKKQG